MDKRLAPTLQQHVLAVLCYDKKFGAAVAAQVKPEFFDRAYQDFAGRVLRYRQKYRRPPGDQYLEDVVSQTSFGKDSKPLQDRLLATLYAEADGLNAEYVAARVQQFVRRQVMKSAIIAAGDRYGQDDDRMVEDVERILTDALRFRQQTFDAGTFISDPKVLRFAEHTQDDDYVPLGIPILDKMGIGLLPKELLLYIAPKGTGKTWFSIHCAVQAMLQRQRVVHYSLEMSEAKISRRYLQTLFVVARNADLFKQVELTVDRKGKFEDFEWDEVKPRLSFQNPKTYKILSDKIKTMGSQLNGLLVKDFPTGQLTVNQLEGHLDYLENVEGFVPNVLIVDYPDLMEIDAKNYRLDLGGVFEGLRGIAVRRNLALVAPTQGNRSTIGARRVRSSDVAEDIRKVNAADTVLAFSRTKQEAELNLGRLSVEHTRDAKGEVTVLLAQSYTTGQYVLKSGLIRDAYWERLKELGSGDKEEEDGSKPDIEDSQGPARRRRRVG